MGSARLDFNATNAFGERVFLTGGRPRQAGRLYYQPILERGLRQRFEPMPVPGEGLTTSPCQSLRIDQLGRCDQGNAAEFGSVQRIMIIYAIVFPASPENTT
jgi:hypothetical protein